MADFSSEGTEELLEQSKKFKIELWGLRDWDIL